jgi:hypothetical protein
MWNRRKFKSPREQWENRIPMWTQSTVSLKNDLQRRFYSLLVIGALESILDAS